MSIRDGISTSEVSPYQISNSKMKSRARSVGMATSGGGQIGESELLRLSARVVFIFNTTSSGIGPAGDNDFT